MNSGVGSQADRSQLFIQLLVGSGLISREELADFKKIAADLKMTLVQAIMSSGSLAKEDLDKSADALVRVQDKQISLDLGIRSLRVAVQHKISLPEAIESAKSLHRTTRIILSAANDLTALLFDVGLLTREKLGKLLGKASGSSMMIGRIMVLEGVISLNLLLDALNALIMIKAGLKRDDAVSGLQYAVDGGMTVEQALFELGTFIQPDAKSIRVGELFLLANLISKEQFAECLEIELLKNKEFGHILEERGLITNKHLDAANELLAAISNDLISPYEAAESLHIVFRDNRAAYVAIAEAQRKREKDVNCRLGDLLIDASACQRERIEAAITKNPDSAVKVGSTLLKAGLISERILYSALRLQTCVRSGHLPRQTALELLKHCLKSRCSLDQAMEEKRIHVPSRMQWSWI